MSYTRDELIKINANEKINYSVSYSNCYAILL